MCEFLNRGAIFKNNYSNDNNDDSLTHISIVAWKTHQAQSDDDEDEEEQEAAAASQLAAVEIVVVARIIQKAVPNK